MSWIAEYDTRGREFPTCVHVTKTTGFMTHGTTYVPIEDGKAVRDENARLREVVADGELHAREILAENAKLRELCAGLLTGYECGHGELCKGCTWDGLGDPKTFPCLPRVKARELGVEVEG